MSPSRNIYIEESREIPKETFKLKSQKKQATDNSMAKRLSMEHHSNLLIGMGTGTLTIVAWKHTRHCDRKTTLSNSSQKITVSEPSRVNVFNTGIKFAVNKYGSTVNR